eukprot:5868918-Prymnesium_polylepis.1
MRALCCPFCATRRRSDPPPPSLLGHLFVSTLGSVARTAASRAPPRPSQATARERDAGGHAARERPAQARQCAAAAGGGGGARGE